MVGAYWGHDHPFNISEALQGNEQTNNRAELTAVIRVLQPEKEEKQSMEDLT